jgi:hypothetical protein
MIFTPPLPELPEADKWQTPPNSLPGVRPIDKALRDYGESRRLYENLVKASALNNPNLTITQAEVNRAFQKAATALGSVAGQLDNWSSQDPARDSNAAVAELRFNVVRGGEIINEGRALLWTLETGQSLRQGTDRAGPPQPQQPVASTSDLSGPSPREPAASPDRSAAARQPDVMPARQGAVDRTDDVAQWLEDYKARTALQAGSTPALNVPASASGPRLPQPTQGQAAAQLPAGPTTGPSVAPALTPTPAPTPASRYSETERIVRQQRRDYHLRQTPQVLQAWAADDPLAASNSNDGHQPPRHPNSPRSQTGSTSTAASSEEPRQPTPPHRPGTPSRQSPSPPTPGDSPSRQAPGSPSVSPPGRKHSF